jgi:hypothetical protein
MAIQFDLLRPDDLLNIHVQGINLRLNAGNRREPVLEIENDDEPAYLVYTFPPQTIAERAYFEAPIIQIDPDPPENAAGDPDTGKVDNDPELDPPGYVDSDRPIAAMLGRPSRLVFKVPAGHRILFTTDGVLDWSALELSVNPIAAIGRVPKPEEIAGAPAIQQPKPTETALEMPYRLIISPTASVAWNHRVAPFTHLGRTELWHTRMQLRSPDGLPGELSRTNTAPMRAIWSPDFSTIRPPDPVAVDPDLGRTAMSPNDRHQIVILTSAFRGYVVDKEIFLPKPLSPFGRNILPENPAGREESTPITGQAAIDAASRLHGSIGFKTTVPYVPEPFEVQELMLSPLGGWLKSRGYWDPPRTAPPPKPPTLPVDLIDRIVRNPDIVIGPRLFETEPESRISPIDSAGVGIIHPDIVFKMDEQLDLSEWVHIATQGRDHYVRIVYEGELWPFRHRAALVKITERKFKEAHGIIGAYMIQRMFIVVREPEKSFNNRGLPFKRVRLTTLVTPDIAEPSIITGTKRSFWVEILTGPPPPSLFRFHAVGTDVAGEQVDFTIPLMFVSISDLPVSANMKLVANAYNSKSKLAERQAEIPGQKVTFAAPNGNPAQAAGNTQLVTESLNLVVNAAGTPPQMLKAEVKIPQVNELLGTDTATEIRYYKDYVDSGFDAATGVFAEIAKYNDALYSDENPFAGIVADTLGANFRSDQAGGFATPNMAVSTLTRELGPVAGQAADALLDSFKPADFFGDGLAFLFGTFDLSKLIPDDPQSTLSKNAPHMTTRTEDIPGGKKVIVNLDWRPQLKNLDLGIAAFEKDYKSPSTLEILGLIEKELKIGGDLAGEPAFQMNGKLTNFRVSVLKSVFINFTEFSFDSRSGQKTDVKVRLDPLVPVEFDGDLKFVEELRQAIPPDLFGDGPSLDISPTGITAGFAFALPPIAVGVFALKDVSLGAALTLPFLDGKPVFDFNVSERQQPFLLAVGIFGGGGFFRLQLDTAGMKMLEAAFEFGATAALDLGVASGEVYIMAGIYFSLQRKEDGTSDLAAVLSGYLRMGGSLSVLGLIKVSVEFNLSFTYDSVTEKAYGRATLTVHVEVLFFSASVELTVERAFGGQSGDPKFGEMYDTAEKWNRYALAFA